MNSRQFRARLPSTLGHTFEPKDLASQPVSPQQTGQASSTANYLRDPLAIQHLRQPQFQPAAVNARPNQEQLLRHQPGGQGMDPVTHIRHNPGQASEYRDAVIPGLQVLRGNAGISEAVNHLLSLYEGNLQTELARGKHNIKKSGRYNSHDSITAPPHLRWPNEGCHSSSGKKRVTYDELTMPQWVAGQLTNIYSISESTLVKQAILQMIFAMQDATSLPWNAVRTAWASSMHEVEEGNLSWADSTQWAINRLSSSQIALAHTQTSAQQSANRRPCKFYNEGSCTYEGHHGNYQHFCNHCMKQGKNLQHPESKCNGKHRLASKQPQATN